MKKDKSVGIPREAFVLFALLVRALVEFDLVGSACLLIRSWYGHADADGGTSALGTRRVIDPCEEGSLEPAQQSPHDAVLITPGSPLAVAQAVGLGLQYLAFLFGLVVYLLEWYRQKCFVEEARVLPLDWHVRE